ncbi:MAG: 2Fe-2S iron-sulfur cluster binding domain-containing protein [Sphingomonadales bacterium]|nr:2Fe-2S iron-sulfur cluster binding domain-containing protein [Sphingomonadales bacterium]
MNKVSLTVERINPQGTDAIELVFLDKKKQIRTFWPGQFITLLLNIDGKSVRRSYSICSVPEDLPRLAVCVKKVEGGLASHYLNSQLQTGDRLEVLEPYGNFSLNYTNPTLTDLVLVGAGSGITPLLSMLKSSLSHAQNRVFLIYGSRSYADILFHDELNKLQTKFPTRLRIEHFLSRNPHENCRSGRIATESLMHALLSWPELKLDEANYYICGPKSMMDEVESGLKSHQTDASRIHRESFVLTVADNTTESKAPITPRPSDTAVRSAHTVQIILEGHTHTLEVASGRHILETALDAGLDLPYACTMGVCGMCRAFKVQGEMHIGEQEALSRAEIEQGYCLTCVGKPLSDKLVIDYDRS